MNILPTSTHRRSKLDLLTGSCKMLQVQSRSPSSSRSNSETCQESSCHLNEMRSSNSFMLQRERLSEAVADISSSVDNVSDIAGVQGFLITGHLTWTHKAWTKGCSMMLLTAWRNTKDLDQKNMIVHLWCILWQLALYGSNSEVVNLLLCKKNLPGSWRWIEHPE